MKAVVLLSGGLDSATALAIAKDQGYACHALSFDYGQRHGSELNAAKKVAAAMNVNEHKILHVDLTQIGGSALTDENIAVPDQPTVFPSPTSRRAIPSFFPSPWVMPK